MVPALGILSPTGPGASRLTPLERGEAACRAYIEQADTGAAADSRLLDALICVGKALVRQDNFAEGRVYLERAQRMQPHVAPDDDLLAAELLHGLARAATRERMPDRAQALLRQELRLLEPYADERPEDVARALRDLAQLWPVAAETSDREIELYDRALDDGRIDVPAMLEPIESEARRGNPEFRLHFLRAAALASDETWPDERGLADALWSLASNYVTEGDTEAALRWFERSWLVRPPEGFEEALAAYRKFSDDKVLALALDARGAWTFGFYVGESTVAGATERALEACRLRLPGMGIEADCRLYDRNGARVWQPQTVTVDP
jgi:tetratricopeptide (TPR) repeat protein